MELAATQGFEVKVVTLPKGQDPADAPDGFEDRLADAESYLLYRVRLELDRSADRQEGFVRVREVMAKAEDSPERQEALRLLADRLDLPRETLAGLAPARGGATTVADNTRLLDAGDRLERDALAACLAHPSLVRGLGELTPGHFDSEVTRQFRAALVAGRDDPELTALKAELDARAAREAIDERTGRGAPPAPPRAEAEARSGRRRSREDDRAAGTSREGPTGARRADVGAGHARPLATREPVRIARDLALSARRVVLRAAGRLRLQPARLRTPRASSATSSDTHGEEPRFCSSA